MHDVATLILAIIGALLTWTISVISLVIWLTGKFRALEILIYREMDKHRREDDVQFEDHKFRIQRLEIRSFGFTENRNPIKESSPLVEP